MHFRQQNIQHSASMMPGAFFYPSFEGIGLIPFSKQILGRFPPQTYLLGSMVFYQG